MIPEIRQIKMNLTLFEQGVEEFMKKAEQVKNDNIELAKENDSLKKETALYKLLIQSQLILKLLRSYYICT